MSKINYDEIDLSVSAPENDEAKRQAYYIAKCKVNILVRQSRLSSMA